ncbi:MAG: DsrE family protein [Alphaproteobacteria bacterium]
MPVSDDGIRKLSIVVFSGAFDRVHYALVMAAAALATNVPVTLFFTMGGARALMKPGDDGRPGWTHHLSDANLDLRFAERGVGTFEDLLSACVTLGATVMVCEMGLRAMSLTLSDLRPDVPISTGGMVTFLADASRDGAIVFVLTEPIPSTLRTRSERG